MLPGPTNISGRSHRARPGQTDIQTVSPGCPCGRTNYRIGSSPSAVVRSARRRDFRTGRFGAVDNLMSSFYTDQRAPVHVAGIAEICPAAALPVDAILPRPLWAGMGFVLFLDGDPGGHRRTAVTRAARSAGATASSAVRRAVSIDGQLRQRIPVLNGYRGCTFGRDVDNARFYAGHMLTLP